MLQTHPLEMLIAQELHADSKTESLVRNENTIVWLLMGDARALLQDDVEQPETARWLRTILAELLPALRDIRDNQFCAGCLSDLLHASTDWTVDPTELRGAFHVLIDTLDELAIRLEWNLPVAEIVPFADLRLARWIEETSSHSHRTHLH
ncbi:hypothetical protein GC176_23655 [bacterium]|nr:hypothetical protein [bacterium]